MSSPRTPPALATRVKRIGAYCEFAIVDTSAEHLARLITNKCLEGAICAGAMVDGKWRALRFADYYECVFGIGLDGKSVKTANARKRWRAA